MTVLHCLTFIFLLFQIITIFLKKTVLQSLFLIGKLLYFLGSLVNVQLLFWSCLMIQITG